MPRFSAGIKTHKTDPSNFYDPENIVDGVQQAYPTSEMWGWSAGGGVAIIAKDKTSLQYDGDPEKVVQNIDQYKFHSEYFQYLSVKDSFTKTITVPERPVVTATASGGGKKGWTEDYTVLQSSSAEYAVTEFAQDSTPIFLCTDANTGRVFTGAVVESNGASFRLMSIVGSSSGIRIREYYTIWDQPLETKTYNISVSVFDQSVDGPDSYPYQSSAVDVTPQRIRFGGGKFDTDRKYFHVSPSGYRMPRVGNIDNFTSYTDLDQHVRLRIFDDGEVIYSLWNRPRFSYPSLNDYPYLYNGDNPSHPTNTLVFRPNFAKHNKESSDTIMIQRGE